MSEMSVTEQVGTMSEGREIHVSETRYFAEFQGWQPLWTGASPDMWWRTGPMAGMGYPTADEAAEYARVHRLDDHSVREARVVAETSILVTRLVEML